MRPLRRLTAVMTLLPFLVQATGAANLPLMMGPAARPGLFPVPVAFKTLPPSAAPQPAAAPMPSHFWKDCAVVARFLYEQATVKPAPVAAARPSRRKIHVETFGPAAEAAPSRDRMMIVKDPMIVDIAEAMRWIAVPHGELPVYRPRVEARWHEAPGLRYRVVYLDSYGITWGDASGFHFYMPGEKQVDVATALPPRFFGEYPVYFHGQTANFDIEIQNTGAEAVEGLRVESVQEMFDPAGEGKPTDVPLVKTISSLKPGATKILHARFFVSNSGHARINLEQTHLKLSTRAGRLADETHAGIVDPPNL